MHLDLPISKDGDGGVHTQRLDETSSVASVTSPLVSKELPAHVRAGNHLLKRSYHRRIIGDPYYHQNQVGQI